MGLIKWLLTRSIGTWHWRALQHKSTPVERKSKEDWWKLKLLCKQLIWASKVDKHLKKASNRYTSTWTGTAPHSFQHCFLVLTTLLTQTQLSGDKHFPELPWHIHGIGHFFKLSLRTGGYDSCFITTHKLVAGVKALHMFMYLQWEALIALEGYHVAHSVTVTHFLSVTGRQRLRARIQTYCLEQSHNTQVWTAIILLRNTGWINGCLMH